MSQWHEHTESLSFSHGHITWGDCTIVLLAVKIAGFSNHPAAANGSSVLQVVVTLQAIAGLSTLVDILQPDSTVFCNDLQRPKR